MEIRGERECKDCGRRWSYFETGEIECPDCGSLRSVGTGSRARHTDGHEDLELTDLVAEVDERPLSELADEIGELYRSYLATRGFIRGGQLRALDDAYLVGPNVLIYTKFVNVSDGGRGVVECRTRFGVDAGRARPAQPRSELSKSGSK